VPHRQYRDLPPAAVAGLLQPAGLLADLKGLWRDQAVQAGLNYWAL
jgi:UDP-N-acetyl-D-glucosamine/UDP-N-acetyl-D-galactosamine dehydrogenase